ncbi:F-box/LRR-repeat protein fbxl-1-like isoform X1 [Aphidius gifuensis]|uniref:F-box/LRR-repeat protein fbxl-1-like isoform X1 n=1 Tax=Aphidius gifuensis TaxID=684658 RepID=UPI001CDCC383|nr:F-box/LRR-repeat protein fbxl-1-like isoform X1 [Aphidius gifuensis]
MTTKRILFEKDQQVSADDVDEKMDLINSLDNDSLAQIFMLLPISDRITVDQVCSKWKEACQLAWHDIKKYKCSDAIVRSYEKCILTQSYVEKILFNCGIYLKELILSKVCNSSIMPIIAEYCKNLTTLEFEIDVNKDDCYSDRFVEACTQLKQLKVVKIHVTGDKFQCQMLNSLPNDINEIHLFFPHESAEVISMNQGVCMFVCCSTYYVSQSLIISLNKFTNLRKLTIHSSIISNIIQEISKKTTLVYLDLQECTTINKIFTFNQLSNLEHLNIKDVSFMDSHLEIIPDLLSGIFNECKKLKHLDAPGFDVDLAEIKMENWVNLKNLVYLNIRWKASDAIINNIIKYCNNLEFINIDKLNSESTIKLTKLENLNYLKFGFTNLINEEVMVAILNNCKKLKHLVIYGSNTVEASIFDDISKLQYIENLNLVFCCNLGDGAIVAIAENCRLLKCLNIKNCSITSTGYIALTSLKNLKELNVGINDNVEDNFIDKLRGIKSLNCSNCNKLTDAGVIQFIKNNPDLEFLDISNTNVTINTIIAAEVAVKNRINDTFLAIKTSDLDLKKACIESQWLIYR